MTFYLANPCTTDKTHPAFRAREAFGYTPTELSSLKIVGVPRVHQVAYSGYRDNIDIFIASTNRQMPLLTKLEGAFLSNTNRPLLALPSPKVGFIPNIHLKPDQEVAMHSALEDWEPERRRNGNTTVFVLQKPDETVLPFLESTAKGRMNAAPDYMTHTGYKWLIFFRRVITEFLCTNTYSAFTPDQIDYEETATEDFMDTTLTLTVPYTLRQVDAETALSVKARDLWLEKAAAIGDGDEPMEAMPEPIVERQTVATFGGSSESVLKANPSQSPPSFNIGTIAEVPALPGMAFPYFHGMNHPDRSTIKRVIGERFFRCLGDSRSECMKQYTEMASAVAAHAQQGEYMEIAHMLVGTDLALKTQTRMFVVINGGEYAGFVLLGSNWAVHDGATWREPVKPDDLSEALECMGCHSAAISKLVTKLSALELKVPTPSGTKAIVTREDLSTSNKLLGEILKRKITPGVQAGVSNALGFINFRAPYKPINLDNIIWALKEMTLNVDKPLDENIHIFIPPSLNGMHDKVMQVLCAFGADSFSFNGDRGATYKIPPCDAKSQDPNEEVDAKGHKFLHTVMVSVKNVAACYSDFNRVKATTAILMDYNERAQKHRNRLFTGGERDKLYAALKECIGGKSAVEVGTSESAAGKRKRDGDDLVHPTVNSFASALSLLPKKK